MEKDTAPGFPITECDIGIFAKQGVLFIRFAFLSHSMQALEEADPGRRYVLTPKQAQQVVDGIQQALRALGSAGPQSPSGERH